MCVAAARRFPLHGHRSTKKRLTGPAGCVSSTRLDMGRFRDEATKAIIALDPKRSAERTLGLLMPYAGATAAGLFYFVGDRLILFASCGVAQDDLDRATDAWDDARESMIAGHTYTNSGFAMVPIGEEAIVYLGTRPPASVRVDTAMIGQLAFLLLAALREPALPQPVVVDVEATPTVDFDRERLTLLLERNEWNIARVARILNVRRSTVYRRIKRCGIERQRVRKG